MHVGLKSGVEPGFDSWAVATGQVGRYTIDVVLFKQHLKIILAATCDLREGGQDGCSATTPRVKLCYGNSEMVPACAHFG